MILWLLWVCRGMGAVSGTNMAFLNKKIIDGYQIELPENWLKEGNVWEIRRAEETVEVKFGGHIEFERRDGRYLFHHKTLK